MPNKLNRTDLLNQMKITTRLIAEEALRRGYDIEYFRGGKAITGVLVIVTPKGRILIKSSVGTLTRGYGIFVATNKYLMGQLFERFGIPTPELILYSDNKQAREFLKDHQKVVVKPVDTNHGVGITVGVDDEDRLLVALERASRVSKKGVLIQEMCSGIDHRVLVVGDKVVAAAYREPAAVTGDGKSSVEGLIRKENKNPLRGKGHSKPLTHIDTKIAAKHLASLHLTLQDVLKKGEVVRLAGVANLSQGGMAVDVTDKVHPKIAAMAVRAAQLAGLGVCGVDIMCTDINQDPEISNPRIIELNESPGIRMHHFPSVGKPRQVAKAIIDQALTNGSYVK